jgi:hypothetical protein
MNESEILKGIFLYKAKNLWYNTFIYLAIKELSYVLGKYASPRTRWDPACGQARRENIS